MDGWMGCCSWLKHLGQAGWWSWRLSSAPLVIYNPANSQGAETDGGRKLHERNDTAYVPIG